MGCILTIPTSTASFIDESTHLFLDLRENSEMEIEIWRAGQRKSLFGWLGGNVGAILLANEDGQVVDRSTLPSQWWAWKVAAKTQYTPENLRQKGNFCVMLSTCMIVAVVMSLIVGEREWLLVRNWGVCCTSCTQYTAFLIMPWTSIVIF